MAASASVRQRIVTTVGQRKIDIELDGFANDVRFRHFDEGRVNLNPSAFNAGLCRDVRQRFENRDEFRPAVRITAVIDRVCADEDVPGRNRFRPGQRMREEDGISRRDISCWNASAGATTP